MLLLRIVELQVHEPAGRIPQLAVRTERAGVEVRAASPPGVPDRAWLVGQRRLDLLPPVIGEGQVEIPDSGRLVIEEQIEAFANAIAVGLHCGRTLISPNPFVALQPEDQQDSDWLQRRIPAGVPITPAVPRLLLRVRATLTSSDASQKTAQPRFSFSGPAARGRGLGDLRHASRQRSQDRRSRQA